MRCHAKPNRPRGLPIAIVALLTSVAMPARASSQVAQSRAVALVVDTSEVEGPPGERLRLALEQQLTEALREAGVELVCDGAATTTIEARLDMPNVGLREYTISFDLLHDDTREVVIARDCLACTELEAVAQAVELVPVVTERLAVVEPPEPPAPSVEAEHEAALDRGPTPHGRVAPGPVGLSGVVALTLGGGAVGAGLLMMSLPGEEYGFHWGLDPRQVGRSILVTGAVLGGVGVTAVVVDAAILERRRRAASLRISPDLSATSAGVWVAGSF